MPRKILTALAAVLVLVAAPAAAHDAPAGAEKPLENDEQKTLYAMGQAVGQQVSRAGVTKEELAYIVQGLTDAVSGTPSKVDMQTYGPRIQQLASERQKVRTEAEKAKGAAYAEKAAKEPGAQKMPSGLIYFETQAGKGKSPTAQDRVKVHYRGTLLDGTEFDSSHKRNAPAEFPLSGVIPCWTEGVQKMKEGGKAKLVCPASIAYGDRGGPSIPGGSTLLFEVELLEVLAAPAAPAPAAPAPTTPAPKPGGAKADTPAGGAKPAPGPDARR